MAEHTPYQKKVIQRYYDQRHEILLARLGEIVTELQLADSDRARNRLWKRAEQAMRGLKKPEPTIERILAQKKPEVLARHLREWLSQGGRH